MNGSSPIRLVCFDLGGVIIRICRTWAEGLDAAGLPVRDGLESQLKGIMDDLHRLVYDHQTGRMHANDYYDAFSVALDGLYAPAEVQRVHLSWMQEQYEGVDRLVAAVNEAGLVSAALSNTNAVHWDQIMTYPAVGLMTHLFASHEIGEHKPDGAAYEHVESAIGHRGGEVLFFDDLPENIAAARARGWNAVQIDHTGDTAAQMRGALAEVGLRV